MTDLEFKNLLHDVKCLVSHIYELADYDQLEELLRYLSDQRMFFAELLLQHYHEEFMDKE